MDFSNKLSRHELRELRREDRKEQRKDDESRNRKNKSRNKVLKYAAAAIFIVAISFGAYNLSLNGNVISADGNDFIQAQLADVPNTFVHWHADVDINVCGEERKLPEAIAGGHAGGGLIGNANMHTHDKQTNLQSLPDSEDGNGVIHNEGNFHVNPSGQTLGAFFDNLGIPLSENGVYEFKNGDLCPDGTVGQLQVLVNLEEVSSPNFLYYIPRDQDLIDVNFGPVQDSSDK
jgi:hypothetical protein